MPAVDRREQPALRVRAVLGSVLDDALGDLAGITRLQVLAVLGALRLPRASPEDPQVVMNLGRGRHGGARVRSHGGRFDGDARAESFDLLEGRAVPHSQELARIRRERLDEPSPPFRVDRVQGEGTLARPRRSSDDRQRVARKLDVDAFQVVGPRAGDAQRGRRRDAGPVLGRLAATRFGALAIEFAQRGARVRRLVLGDHFRRARHQDAPSAGSALGSEVDDVVAGPDQLEVVLDDDHGVPHVDQPLQRADQPTDVLLVQARGGLVQEIQRVPGRLLREVRDQLEALCLPARDRRRRLAKGQVTQADVDHEFERSFDLRMIAEERQSFLGGAGEHVGDRVLLEAHVQRLGLEAMPATFLARHGDGGQELQFDETRATALAVLAATTFDVEREARLVVAT